jgi:hypothetical protein
MSGASWTAYGRPAGGPHWDRLRHSGLGGLLGASLGSEPMPGAERP